MGLYAEDGLCHNSEPGTFNHECEKPASWLGTTRSGFHHRFLRSMPRGRMGG